MHKAHIHCNNSGGVTYASVVKAATSIRWWIADGQLDRVFEDFAKE